ncbi:hypothetical protein ACFQFH_20120 [Halobaculum halobium]
MVLDTTAEVDKIDSVRDRNGDPRPPANADKQDVTNARLGNYDSLTQVVHSTGGTDAEPLPSLDVPEGAGVLVEYKSDNSGDVFVGDADTQESPLTGRTDSLLFSVTDTSLIHVRTPNAGDAVVVTFEGGE